MSDRLIEVKIESVRVSLLSQHRIAVLQEKDGDRYLPIWIGPFEAEAIAMQLRKEKSPRPLTHDLLHQVLLEVAHDPVYVEIASLMDDVYLARLVFNAEDNPIMDELDCRASDALALAVRFGCPIYVDEEVMNAAGKVPDEEIPLDEDVEGDASDTSSEDLELFRDVVEGLDLGSLSD